MSTDPLGAGRRAGDLEAWLGLAAVSGIGPVVGRALVERFGHPRAVFVAGRRRLQAAGLPATRAAAIETFDGWGWVREELDRLGACGGALLTWEDPDYPRLLRHIHAPPLVLYVRGRMTAEDAVAVAVVGSRAASVYARRMARTLAADLARSGVTVVSGLARGVDGEAHRAALGAGGRTVAVLGSGVDVVYPAEHRPLFMEIVAHGAVVSEFPLGTPPRAEHFPRRNRLISGLALGTVVVAAAERSGSLITARYALEQGREVFVVPGPVDAGSRGAHRLLRDGAALAEGAEDVLAAVAPQIPVRREAAMGAGDVSGPEARVLAALDSAGTTVDEIAERVGLTVPQALELLLALELRGLAASAGGRYVPAAPERP